jgi:hypothetical protein
MDLVDYESKNVDKDLFSITAYFNMERTDGVVAEIDRANKKIIFNLPYYASDTEPILSNVDHLILSANLPDGAILTPKLQMVRDLTNPVTLTIKYVNSETEQYEMSAKLIKSNEANIIRMTFSGLMINYSITEKDGENKILIYRTSSVIYNILKNMEVRFTVSPWATINVEDGAAMDLTVRNRITVTAQDGTTKDYYTEMVDPEYVPYGEVGQITCLFGWQTTLSNPHGFAGNSNRSLAVVEDELIVANDNGNFLRFNRYTGELLNKTVRTPDVAPYLTMAIDSDDKGTLLMTVFAMLGNASHSQTVDFYVWKNGLDNLPEKIFSKPVGEVITSGDIGRTISVKGDLLNGKAVIGLIAKTLKQGLIYRVENGVVTNPDNPWRGNYSVEFNNNGKLIPVDTEDNPSYILSGIVGRIQYYCTTSPASTRAINPAGNWWTSDIKGADYMEFNGVKMLAVQNGVWGTNNADNYNRLVVADITTYAANAFDSKRIMDSRLQNFDPNFTGAQNSSLTGMTSYYHSSGIIGNNGNKNGDVCFGKNEDGSAVQIYMLTTGHGIIAYDISRFVPFQ